MEMVIPSGGYEAGARDEGDDDPTAVAVLGFAETNSGDGAGVLVGSAAWRGVCGRKISRIRVCGVLPACAEATAEGRGREGQQGNVPGAGGALQRLPVVQGVRREAAGG